MSAGRRRARGADQRIFAIDLNESKLALARQFGATDAMLASDPNCVEAVKSATGGGVDFAFEMAGSMPAMNLAYAIGRRGSTTVCAGLPSRTATFALPSAALVADERVIKGSYMGSAVPSRDIPRFIDYFLNGQMPIDRLRSHLVTFDELNAAFDRLDEGVVVRQVLDCSAPS